MHDPLTVAHEIKSPVARRSKFFPEGYRRALVTVWHRDPEKDGSDDSCGWSYPKVPTDAKWFRELTADVEFVCRTNDNALRRQRLAEGRVMWWVLWLHRASFHHRRKPLSARLVNTALYHDSFPGNRDGNYIERDPKRLAWVIARVYLQLVRPWWRHPRWHIWHWRLQVHDVQAFKRWAFSRCCKCGKRFRWNESPVAGSWHGTGPRWFRGERDVRHTSCASVAVEGKSNAD